MNIGKICLGTAQLGLNYGINNKTGKPCKDDAFEILDKARNMGITYLDTAAGYGNSEEIIGMYMASTSQKDCFRVITKISTSAEIDDQEEISSRVEQEVLKSLANLKADKINGCLLHNYSLFKKRGTIQGLLECREKGLIENIGVSVYEPEEALEVIKHEKINYIQIPYNIFDHRLDKTDFFKEAKKNKIKVFARSVFIQGLILLEDKDIPQHLKAVKEHLNSLDRLIKKYSMTRLEAAFLYVYKNSKIDYLVIGMETKQQLNDYVRLSLVKDDLSDFANEVSEQFTQVEKELIMPNLWKNK